MGLGQLPFGVVEDVLQREVNLFRRADGEHAYNSCSTGFDCGRFSHVSAAPFRLVNGSSCSKRMAAGVIQQHHQKVSATSGCASGSPVLTPTPGSDHGFEAEIGRASCRGRGMSDAV